MLGGEDNYTPSHNVLGKTQLTIIFIYTNRKIIFFLYMLLKFIFHYTIPTNFHASLVWVTQATCNLDDMITIPQNKTKHYPSKWDTTH